MIFNPALIQLSPRLIVIMSLCDPSVSEERSLTCAPGRLLIRWRLCACLLPRLQQAPPPAPSSATPSCGREAPVGSSPGHADGRCSSAGHTHTHRALASSPAGTVSLYSEAEAGLAADEDLLRLAPSARA